MTDRTPRARQGGEADLGVVTGIVVRCVIRVNLSTGARLKMRQEHLDGRDEKGRWREVWVPTKGGSSDPGLFLLMRLVHADTITADPRRHFTGGPNQLEVRTTGLARQLMPSAASQMILAASSSFFTTTTTTTTPPSSLSPCLLPLTPLSPFPPASCCSTAWARATTLCPGCSGVRGPSRSLWV